MATVTNEKTAKRKKRRIVEEEELDLEMDFLDEEEDDEEEEEESPRRKKKGTKSGSSSKSSAIKISRKLIEIKKEMAVQLFEREDVIADLMRALVSGENILLLGPPGTAKSMLAEIFFSHIEKADLFKWLMNRTTDPSDIVGPYSVTAMENDKFLRVTTGKMPEAHGAFLDEIFKANEPVMNFMLSMLNEKVFYNDGKPNPVNLRITIGASNEYPESDDLEAFYDRFIFRHWVNYIQDPQNRMAMGAAARNRNANILPPTMITLDEIDEMQEAVHKVQFPDRMAKDYDRLIRALQKESILVSDRRYTKGQTVMMANALLNGRTTVTGDDFKSLRNVLWNKNVAELDIIEKELGRFVNPHESKIKELKKRAEEVRDNTLKIENRTERAGEAVQANGSLQDIIGKMEDEIEEAKTNGVDTSSLETMVEEVEGIMEQIATECLKQSSRGAKRAW